MTEEDGSVLTAKAIQRHRDLLLPVIERHDGCGKSTGGDGLVAAFESAADALAAAVEMQRALADAQRRRTPDEREICGPHRASRRARSSSTSGGRPFIGAALNLAARVMNLADGGQVFATASRRLGGTRIRSEHRESLGDFELKNIAKPVEVVEVLWAEGQEPLDPPESSIAEPE